jgi:4-alpha-glucanotransferase
MTTSNPWGIDATYEDAAGKVQRVSEQTIEAIRTAMGRLPSQAGSPFDEPVLVMGQNESKPLPGPAELILEEGSVLRLADQLPGDLPIGYHQLIPLNGSSRPVPVIISPKQCHLPSSLRVWGWSAQLYAARSRQSWGMGDLADLRRLTEWAQSQGAGLVLINPLHATAPVLPQEPSPYSPSSRRYLNPLYLRIEDIPGAPELGQRLQELAVRGRALNDDRLIDRDQVFRLKRQAWQLLWSSFHGDPEFERFRTDGGKTLREFATFCALAEHHGADWRRWPPQYRRPDSPAVQQYAESESDRVAFHEWLQWLMNRQLARAAQPVPLMQDLPVGFSPDGADAWIWQDLIAGDMSVGAPPDLHSAQGQDWGLPPFIPHRLRETAYEPFIQTIRAVLRHAEGLRIDHVMGLFRLWWVPKGGTPKDGAYVRYPVDDLLSIIALESHRAGAVVVGEDLGTVESGVREQLADRNVLSYRLLWFEDQPPSEYPEKALAAVTTHDLPTLVGVWTGADLRMQERVGVEPDRWGHEKFRSKVMNASEVNEEADVAIAILQTYEQLTDAPSMILMADLETACVTAERPNMPSAPGKYPNWSVALPVPLETLETAEFPRTLAQVLSERGNRRPSHKNSGPNAAHPDQ